MKIGIIGAGHIGGTLTRRLRELDHEVIVANSRGPQTLLDLSRITGATPVPVGEAAHGRDLVVVTIPLRSVPELPPGLIATAAPGVVVVDTCNYYPERDGRIAEIEGGQTESEWVAHALGHTVVKAFNTIQAGRLAEGGREALDPERLALPVAGDDLTAKSTVVQLVEDLGFDAVDAGSLRESWRQQPGTPAYGADLQRDELVRVLAATRPGRPPEFRA